jgi:hypothetical protein
LGFQSRSLKGAGRLARMCRSCDGSSRVGARLLPAKRQVVAVLRREPSTRHLHRPSTPNPRWHEDTAVWYRKAPELAANRSRVRRIQREVLGVDGSWWHARHPRHGLRREAVHRRIANRMGPARTPQWRQRCRGLRMMQQWLLRETEFTRRAGGRSRGL